MASRIALAKSSCAKIRNLMSVLFNHACRYELFDRNPIYLVRQSAKRRTAPSVLEPAEIKALIDGLALRERTLVLLAASTGLRQSEVFGLKWRDIDFSQGAMNVTRSIVYGMVGPCKTESSQKPVPIHPTRERSDAVEKRLHLHQARRLGIRQQALSRSKTVLGPGDLAQIYTSCSATSRNSEAIRMAYVPAHLLDPAAKCGD